MKENCKKTEKKRCFFFLAGKQEQVCAAHMQYPHAAHTTSSNAHEILAAPQHHTQRTHLTHAGSKRNTPATQHLQHPHAANTHNTRRWLEYLWLSSYPIHSASYLFYNFLLILFKAYNLNQNEPYFKISPSVFGGREEEERKEQRARKKERGKEKALLRHPALFLTHFLYS